MLPLTTALLDFYLPPRGPYKTFASDRFCESPGWWAEEHDRRLAR
jgi:hypothetical protein